MPDYATNARLDSAIAQSRRLRDQMKALIDLARQHTRTRTHGVIWFDGSPGAQADSESTRITRRRTTVRGRPG